MTRRRFSNCACDGSWRSKLPNWRVLEPGEPSSLLYCLRCRFEWRSRAKYRLALATHVKHKRGTVTDAEILVRLFDRRDLRIDPISAVVESSARVGEWRQLATFADSHDSGYRFVKVNFDGRQRKIGVHVLQMMNSTGEVIPDGFDVDHRESPPRPQEKDNSLGNLRIVKSRLNQSHIPDQCEFAFVDEGEPF